jgi:uncharacterized protein YkwD
MRPIHAAAIALTALTASAHAEPKTGIIFDPVVRQIIFSPDDSLAAPLEPAAAPVAAPKDAAPKGAAPMDAAPIEAPPLPRPRPPMQQVTGDNPAALISAFRRQHGEGPVAVNSALTRLAQQQANAMAARDTLDHNVLGPFSGRVGRANFDRAAENIAYGHSDFPRTLKQWINSPGHRANLLMRGAKWVGVAHARNGRRTYWAMVIGTGTSDRAARRNIRR